MYQTVMKKMTLKYKLTKLNAMMTEKKKNHPLRITYYNKN